MGPARRPRPRVTQVDDTREIPKRAMNEPLSTSSKAHMNAKLRTLPLLLSVATLAAAQEGSGTGDIAARANCAEVELAQALGEKVDPSEVAACSSRAKPAPTPRPAPPSKKGDKCKKGEPPARDGIFVPPSFPETPMPPPPPVKPSWLDGKLADGSVLYGVGAVRKSEVGAGQERMVAFQRAIFEIAAQLQVRIDASTVDRQTNESVEATDANGRTKRASLDTQSFSATTQMLVQATLDGVVLVDQYRDPKSGSLYVLASLDQEEIARREQAVADAVLRALAEAAEGVSQAFATDRLSPEVLHDLGDALEQASTVGRSPVGRKVRDRWKREYEEILRLGRRLSSCADVDGGLEADGRTVRVKVSCAGKVWRGARFTATPAGGLVDLPASIATNREGEATFVVGPAYGQSSVKVGFAHDLSGTRTGAILGQPKPSQRATIELPANASPVASLKLVVPSKGNGPREALGAAVDSFVSRRLGLTIDDAGSPALKVIATVTFASSQQVGARVSQPIELNVSVVGPRGRLFEKSVRTAGLAANAADAQGQAVQRAVDAMRGW